LFTGLVYERGISPTDIDGLLDFGGKLFILWELKYLDAELPDGQRIALARICDTLQRGGAEAWVLVGRHSVPALEPAETGTATLSEYRVDGEWKAAQRQISLRDAIDIIRRKSRLYHSEL
jgi:hypothetical protein